TMRGLEEYYERIDAGRLPVFRGFELNRDDLIRRDVITKLICNFVLDFGAIEQAWGIGFHDYFGQDLLKLEGMAEDGLLEMDDKGIRVMPRGRLLIRNICMAFDAYLPPASQQKNFSKVI
ncbi:MAG: coproporphyrinogen III oxidase, partial [Sedimenticola sp.]